MVVTLGGNPYAGIGRAGGGRRRDEQSRHYRGNLHCNLDGNFEHDSGQRHNDSDTEERAGEAEPECLQEKDAEQIG